MANYTEIYLGKTNITEISYSDIENYFKEPQEESDRIEYKSFVSSVSISQSETEKNIIKSICAFLNSEGGLLIWGAPKGIKEEDKKEKIFKGDLSSVEYLYEKDQLIRKISDKIIPTPKGILFHRITNNGKYIYIFEVAKSEYSPHQYEDKFYMRIDGQTKTAPYHYIDALFKKIKFPNLNGFIKITNWQQSLNENKCLLHIDIYIYNYSKLQNDYNVSYRLFCDKGKFDGWNSHFGGNKIRYVTQGHEMIVSQAKDIIHYGEPIKESHSIEVDRNFIIKDNKIKILLLFGAKYSPMKVSEYTITLPIIDEPVKNYNILFTDINENRFMHEISDKTEEEKRKIELGRLIS